ncbi:unnamed protein product [Arabidopsis halleri]
MTTLKSANKELKRLMKTVKIPDDLMGELDALEADMGNESEADGVPSNLQPCSGS